MGGDVRTPEPVAAEGWEVAGLVFAIQWSAYRGTFQVYLAGEIMNDDEDTPEDTGKADDVAESPNDAADPKSIVEAKIPKDIRDCYEVYSYRNAAIILAETRKKEFEEILNALRSFSISTQTIKTAGGNETEIPKNFSATLRPLGWQETRIRGDLNVTLTWREQVGVNKRGKPVREEKSRILTRKNYLDGHKIDYVKEKIGRAHV